MDSNPRLAERLLGLAKKRHPAIKNTRHKKQITEGQRLYRNILAVSCPKVSRLDVSRSCGVECLHKSFQQEIDDVARILFRHHKQVFISAELWLRKLTTKEKRE